MASAHEPSAAPEAAPPQRLADQLHDLAAVSESLTYRLLELEERLAEQERRLTALDRPDPGAGSDASEALAARLGETEQRIERVEALLAGLEHPGPGRRLQALPGVERASSSLSQEHGEVIASDDAEDPFYEEGEQPFMDERTA